MESCILCLEVLSEIDAIKVNKSRGSKDEGWNLIELHFVEFLEEISSHSRTRQLYSCSDCWKSLESFHTFYDKIKSKHKNFHQISEVTIKEEKDEEEVPIKFEVEELPIKAEDEVKPKRKIERRGRKNTGRKLKMHIWSPKAKKRTKHSDESFLDKQDENDEKIKSVAQMSCELCQKELHTFKHALYHYGSEHRLKGYLICCDKKFMKRCRLLDHLTTKHFDTKFWKCEICGKNFHTKQTWRAHMRSHQEKIFECDCCPKKFATKPLVRNHLISVHALELRLHIINCHFPNCKRTFSVPSLLNYHIRTDHNREKEIICEICSKVCKTKNLLDDHMVTHTKSEQERFQCHICGNYQSTKRIYNRHMKNHTTEGKDNICEICGFKSLTKRSLENHVRNMHKLGARFECGYCDKKFKTRANLKDHEQAIHTGDASFECEFCGRKFTNQGNMMSHRKNAHPDQYIGPFYARPDGVVGIVGAVPESYE